MGQPGIQSRTWTLCVIWMCVGLTEAEPYYMVTFPAVLEAGAETQYCVSLLQPSETLVLTVTLMSQEKNTTLLEKTSSIDFHSCFHFKVPLVQDEEVQNFKVEVRGSKFYSSKIKKVMIVPSRPMTFVQTDKPIYLPGQTVHFRVVSLDTKFRPASRLYDVIEIMDPMDNRIGQWLNQSSNGKILQLSYSLNSEAREGEYRVSVTADQIIHRFEVKKYVLPKFDVKIDTSDEVSVEQEDVTAQVCAKYTYGQPVPGSVIFEMCVPVSEPDIFIHPGPDSPKCYRETKETGSKGCATFTVKMSTLRPRNDTSLRPLLDINVKVKEKGTDISRVQGKRIHISYVIGKLSFIDTPKIYEQGSNVEGKVKAVYYNNTPIPDMPVYLMQSSHLLQNLTTNSDGIAAFSLSTASFHDDIRLHLSTKPHREYQRYQTPYYVVEEHKLSEARQSSPYTESVSFLTVMNKDEALKCDKEEDMLIKYTVVKEAQGPLTMVYLVLARGAIVMQGSERFVVQDKSVSKGEVSFKLKVTPEMAPKIQIVAYTVLPSETVIAHTAEFSTEKCLSHKVSLEFSQSLVVPGEKSTMQLTAQPHSLCGVSAVDQSVLIIERKNILDIDKIFNLLPMKDTFPYQVEDDQKCLHVRPRRYILPYPGEDDAYRVFKNVGLKMATNLVIQMPSCLQFKGISYHKYEIMTRYRVNPVGLAPGGRGDPLPPLMTVRSFFPETWIWDLVEVGESGTTSVSYTVPDTITTWETEAFCLSPQGFGLAPRKELQASQPFFLELSLPYSIIRGEHFELKATVFNYLPSCIMVSVNPVASLNFTLTPHPDTQYTSCVCGSKQKTFSWTMVPSAIGVIHVSVEAKAVASHASCDNEIVSVPERGRIDVVTRSLIVKAEGTEMTKTYNWLLCPQGGALTEDVDILLPENVIDGSARAFVSVLGDILGRALKNLDGLLKMPYGCGEQNMALLAPNIYILQYLKNTQQLTPAIMEKATNFLTSGYQRQLNYKHYDGAYSTFGTGIENTWLTAFVLRSFVKAQSFVYIDPENIRESKTWLETKQIEDGCFEKSGELFNNRMKGGVSDIVTLSAYITAAFLEMGMEINDPVLNKSLSCLKASTTNLNNTYTTALLAYVFTLAGDMQTRAHLLQHLDEVALRKGGFIHWSQTATDSSASLSVEISSYVLLAKLSASPTAEDLSYAHFIVKWLTGQQNHHGGFSSTQDTVVALQALALYSTLVFSLEGSSIVTVQSPSGQLTFDVNQSNKLLYQEKILQDVIGRYSLEVKGTACISMQISLLYNIPTPTDVTTLSVEVKPEADCQCACTPKLTLNLKSLYSGKEDFTNMVIIDIKMLSGFIPDPESLKTLSHGLLVNRLELKEDNVLVYMEKLPKDIPIFNSLKLIQVLPVQNMKPALVKIYDYYQPSDHSETEYMTPCAAA
ncbi:hypothetical protein PAMA_020858 [Pampus argenteus]